MSSLGFSYAQAAKGLAPSSAVSSNPTSSASSEHGAKETSTNAESSISQSRNTRPQKSDKDSVFQQKSTPANALQNDAESALQKEKALQQSADSIVDDSRSTRSHQSSVDDFTATAAVTTKTVETASSLTAPASDEPESGRKGSSDASDSLEKAREADDEWEKVSIPSNSAEKELKAAPIPVVNIWQQRQAQQAKKKEQTVQRQPAPSQSQTKPQPSQINVEEPKKKAAPRENVISDTARNSPGRLNNSGRTVRDQRGASASPRSSSQQNDQTPVRPPPPADAASWPTPESAIVDSGRRSSILEKTDKGENLDVKPSNRKNQWTTLPFVPSVKFETQIPSSRRGGRAGNTRGARGATTTQSERNTERSEPTSMGPPSVPKGTSEQDRGRKSNNSRTNRASSMPTEVQETGTSEDKIDTTSAKDSTTTASKSSTPFSQENTTSMESSSSKDLSRSSSQQAPSNSVATSRPKVDAEQSLMQDAELVESLPKQSQRPEKGHSASAENVRPGNDAGEKGSKEWTKDRSNKNETWRPDQRGERAERGRGNYRGRGGRAPYSNPSFTTPLPQNGFETGKHGTVSDPRASRQSSQTYGTPSFSNRSNTRAQSIPVGMLQGPYFSPSQGFAPTPAPIQTDMNYASFSQMPNGMPTGMMTAIPYNEPLNGYALISMVSRQLEYYFSLDNLCKDMFLRKNMDSQGFVLLRVIAEFRRIKTLLGEGSMSYEHLRGVAAHVPNTEFVTAEDGEDRLRSRGNWRDFVLPVEERVPQAQNDGPQIKSNRTRHSIGMPPDFHMGNGLRSAPPNINGFQEAFVNHAAPIHFAQGLVMEPQASEQWSGQEASHDEDRRTSVTSPLSKVQSPSQESKGLYGGMPNGHRDSMSSATPAKENTFPDENIAFLKVVVKDPEYQGHEDTVIVDDPASARNSGLRGGAGSPEQFERIRGLQFGQNTVPQAKSNEQTMYFTEGEGPRPELMKPGYIHEDYVTLREQAYNQRAEDHFDGALLVLYPLWADFLAVPHQFNVGMYEEFKTWALEDQEKGNENGKRHLVKLFDTMLNGSNVMSERLSNDIVSIARSEVGSDRQTWLKLRGAWRNGATNLKTRKRLADLLTPEEREELDRNS